MGMPNTMAGILATALAILTYLAIYLNSNFGNFVDVVISAIVLVAAWFVYFVIARIIVGFAAVKRNI